MKYSWFISGAGSALLLGVLLLNWPAGKSEGRAAGSPVLLLRDRAAIPALNPPVPESRAAGLPGEDNSRDEEKRAAQWLSVSPDRRAALMSTEAMAPYAPILAALDLPPSRLRRLQELMVERAECARDAENLGRENRLPPAQTDLVRQQAEAAFDREMEEVVGCEKLPVVREMLQLSPQLAQIIPPAGPDLGLGGVPLTASQRLQLAQAYREAYVGDADDLVERTTGFDPQTGLGDADRQALRRATAFLTVGQVELLRNNLAKLTVAGASR